ncbi:prolyl 4-hydroxylase subunit alpha-2-like isoform X2 [Melanaphis sacchari]|uniref:prolyl 4-hydroxylase subunit alpha-2-like isoform X2 n=1 Tax=Melanaphis sacchari TaxID=742174 RepID=UPI000DC1415F|nr:prolyl 4-hydroxylase subunit alpha-2-like isoform X2 [Melanaphis sacchari]
MLINMLTYLAIVFSLLMFIEAEQRWHTSQIILSKLYDLQNDHFNALNKYLDLEVKRLEELKNYVNTVYEWRNHKKTNKDFLYNHLDVTRLMKQMHHHFFKIKDLIENKLSIEALKEIDEHKDLSGNHVLLAHLALRRLQIFYAIPASDMSAGRFNDRIIGDRMDACECYVMAKYCSKANDMYGVIEWAVETYYKWESDGQPKCVDSDILNFYIVSSSIYTGFDFMNLIHINRSTNLQKDTDKFLQYYHLIKNELFELDKKRALYIFEVYYYLEGRMCENEFRYLCQHGVSRTITKYSKCRYQTKNSFYRILMPFKEEDINNEPLIKIYHDVLYENEILRIKTMASENMRDAGILAAATGSTLNERSRSGQVYWINYYDAVEYFDSLNTRIETFTGFSTKTAELYQIVNYGLGGHYLPHHDPFQKGIVYLTDVKNDGYTAFPKLNIVASTEKGAALVWHNLNIFNGELIDETLHGSCPLLKGNKWIMTKWLYEEGQYLSYDWKNK